MKNKARYIAIVMAFTIIISDVNYTVAVGEKIISYDIEEMDPNSLYALSAVLMDGVSGRVLYEKEGLAVRANASTTKILTCILALEYGNKEDIVDVSKYAASMPDVQLGIREGEHYRLGDLLYSMMLESHNDVAVAIAEHIAGSVDEFAILMNEKANEIGCFDTYFITPNGLDATRVVDGVEKFHGTTAVDLARIMSYCIKNEEFLKITGTDCYSFNNKIVKEDGSVSDGSRNFSVYNKNAFLTMMEGAFSGKTGFTCDAGYCYVGALKRGDNIYVVALLGCGWPNNKKYKWSDTKKLMNYGIENYTLEDIFYYNYDLGSIKVKNGKTLKGERENIVEDIEIPLYIEESPIELLMNENDKTEWELYIKREMDAPVKKGQVVGHLVCFLNNEIIKQYNVYSGKTIEEKDYVWSLKNVIKKYFMIE